METRASKSWSDNGERSCLQPRQVKLQRPHRGQEWGREGEKKGDADQEVQPRLSMELWEGASQNQGVCLSQEGGCGGQRSRGEGKGVGAGSWSQALPRTEHLLCSQRRKPSKLVNKGKRPEGRQLRDKSGTAES